MTSATDRANAAFYNVQAAAAFAAEPPDITLGLYLLDAADYWAEPTEAQTAERTVMLTAALSRVGSTGTVTARPETGE